MQFKEIIQLIQLVGGIVSPLLLAYIAFITTRKNQLEMQLNDKKRELFESFVEALIESLNNKNKDELKKKIEKQMMDIRKDLILFGSPKTIKAFNVWVLNNETASKDNRMLFTNIENFIKALREEIGLSNFKLNRFDLLQVFVKDDLVKFMQK